MPATFESLLLIVFFILPGFIIIRIRDFFIQPSKSSELNTILNSILFSCLNYIIWLPFIITILRDLKEINFSKLNLFSSTVLITIISPIIIGVIIAGILKSNIHYKVFQCKPIRCFLRIFKLETFIRTGNIWSIAFDREHKPWVRIHLNNGLIYQDIAKHISSESDKKSFYLTNVTILDADGNIKQGLLKKGLEGVYINAEKAEVIEVYK